MPWPSAERAAVAAIAIVAIMSVSTIINNNNNLDDNALITMPSQDDGGYDHIHTVSGNAHMAWSAPFVPKPVHAADAFVITDLGNTFKLNVEDQPGINWTQVLLDRLAEVGDQSRQSDRDLRSLVDNYIQNNTDMLNERTRQFEEYRRITNASFSDLINRDVMLNSSINQIVQNIDRGTRSEVYQSIMDKEAAVSALSSQVRYVYYDNPATLMTCPTGGGSCSSGNIESVQSVSTGTSYAVYNDPTWLKPSIYAISPIHHNARYTDVNTFAVTTIPGNNIRLYNTFLSWAVVDGNGDFLHWLGGSEDPDSNILVWGCHSIVCGSWARHYMPFPVFEDRIVTTPVGYPYHVNMVTKETTPDIEQGQSFLEGDLWCYSETDCRPIIPAAARNFLRYNTTHAPFDYEFRPAGAADLRFETSELLEAGMGRMNALNKYFSTDNTRPSWPMPRTPQTWPNCDHLPICSHIGYAFDDFVPANSSSNREITQNYYRLQRIPDSWRVFLSPQIHVTTWDENNALTGNYSTLPQFVDRMNRQIITPVFSANNPPLASEAGKIYDVRGYVSIPFATDSPMNVSHVSLRPSGASLDLNKIGRDYMRDTATTPSDLYGIAEHEFERMGLINCEFDGSWTVNCEKRGQDLRTLDIVWVDCRFGMYGDGRLNTCVTMSDIGDMITKRSDFTSEKNANLPTLEGVYSGPMYIPLVQGYDGFRLVIDGVGIYTKYQDVRSDNHLFLSPPRSASVGKVSSSPIHYAVADVSTTAEAVAPRSGEMSILAVVSATGTLDIRNEYYTNITPPRPRVYDPLAVEMKITKNGEHYATKSLGINEHPTTTVTNTVETVNFVRTAVRGVNYDYPSFVFAGSTSVPVVAGDHVLFELTAKIDGKIGECPCGNPDRIRGMSTADISINAASILMGVG